jgi:transcriptional regulator GlxA family with amidase domain
MMGRSNADAIPVAFLLDDGATVIDFAGAWDVFSDASKGDVPLFRPLVIAPTKAAIRTISGMTVTPDFAMTDAPRPKVLVIPAQGHGGDPKKLAWIRATYDSADTVLSVCTGSFLLARAHLLDGKEATTHPDAFELFEKTFPSVRLRRDLPFVFSGKIGTASAGLTGVDLALNAVAQLTERAIADEVAKYMGHAAIG